jgi:hypothetical protein
MVNAAFTPFLEQSSNPLRAKATRMDAPFITGRAALADAAELMDRFGEGAASEAAARAALSRDSGNVTRFCHWRQIERVIASLASDEVHGPVH